MNFKFLLFSVLIISFVVDNSESDSEIEPKVRKISISNDENTTINEENEFNDGQIQLNDPDSQPTFADTPESLYDSFDRDNESSESDIVNQNPPENISGILDNGNSTVIDGILGLNSTNETLPTNTSTKPPKVLISCVPYVPKEYRILVPVEIPIEPDTNSTETNNNETLASNNTEEGQGQPLIQMEEKILEYTPTVEIVNVTKLQQEILWSNSSIRNKSTPANCSIILFYASWCRYSANAAPHYNALPRAFPPLRVVAVDSYKYKSVTSHYGILAVPTILLFHNGKAVAKFNGTSFTLNRYVEFVESFSELKSVENVNVTSQDFMGPLPTTVTEELDIWLVLAWVFIILCFLYYISNSTLWKKIVDLILSTWREAEDQQQQPLQHEHLD